MRTDWYRVPLMLEFTGDDVMHVPLYGVDTGTDIFVVDRVNKQAGIFNQDVALSNAIFSVGQGEALTTAVQVNLALFGSGQSYMVNRDTINNVEFLTGVDSTGGIFSMVTDDKLQFRWGDGAGLGNNNYMTGLLGGIVQFAVGIIVDGRIQGSKGADIASANTITLGNDGNSFDITGTTTINNISVTGWQSGSRITLKFDGALTFTDQAGGSGQMRLAGSGNLTTAANTRIMLELDGTEWWEISRTVA